MIKRLERVGTVPMLTAAGLLSFTPLVVLAVLSIQIGSGALRAQVDDRLTSSADLSAGFVGVLMQDALDVTSAFATGPLLRAAVIDGGRSPEDFGVIRGRLAQLQSAVSGSNAAFIVDPAGTLTDIQPLDPAVVGRNFSQRDWYTGVLAKRAPYLSEAYVSALVGNPLVVAVAAPVFADNSEAQPLAILVVNIPTKAIQDFTDQHRAAGEFSLTVVDQRGNLVAGPGVSGGALHFVGGDPRVKAALAGHSGVGELTSGGRRTISAYSPIPLRRWALLAQVDRELALADARRLQTNVLVLTGILSLIIAAGLAMTAVNLAQRRRAVHELREQGQQRQQILDGLPVGVFVVDTDGRRQYANRVADELLGPGLTPGAAPAQLSEVYQIYVEGTNDVYARRQLPLARALTGEYVRSDDIEIARADGRAALEVWASPIYSEDGRQIAALEAFLDVTDRKRTQSELARLNSELELRVKNRTAELAASNQELEAFTYSVSHDLRAPLRAMAGFASKLREKTESGPDPELSRYALRIAVNAQRMGQLIDELLTLSRLSRQDLTRVSFIPGDAARRALEDLRGDVQQTHAEVTIADMRACDGDPGLVQQVYANLLSNALKYSRNRTHPLVEVGSTWTAETGTVYYVRDNGAGFDMRFKDKLFGVFQRLHGADEYEGIGVGLAIVKRIVTRHGGKVFADGVVDRGATFSFTLGGP